MSSSNVALWCSLVEQMEWSELRREDAADAEAGSIVRSLCALAAALAQRDSLSEALDLLAACHRFKPPWGSALPATLQVRPASANACRVWDETCTQLDR